MGGIKKEAEGWCNSWGSPILRKKGKETERINTNESAVGVSGKIFFPKNKGETFATCWREREILLPRDQRSMIY